MIPSGKMLAYAPRELVCTDMLLKNEAVLDKLKYL